MATFDVSDKVKVELSDLPYAGIILSYDATPPVNTYKVSIQGKGEVIELSKDNIFPL